jgi:hypothetical protein
VQSNWVVAYISAYGGDPSDWPSVGTLRFNRNEGQTGIKAALLTGGLYHFALYGNVFTGDCATHDEVHSFTPLANIAGDAVRACRTQ